MKVSTSQKDFYHDNGYLVIENFISEKEISALKGRTRELVDAHERPLEQSVFDTSRDNHIDDDYFKGSGGNISFFYEKLSGDSKATSLNKIGHALHDMDEVFEAFSRQQKIKQVVEGLGIDDARLLQSMYIFKPPFVGGEVTLHQDASFLHVSPNTIMGLWFALDDATKENGCLWAMPGEHRREVQTYYTRKGDSLSFIEQHEANWELDRLVPLEVKAGSLVVLHGNLPHMSYENHSDKQRHAYTIHLMDGCSTFLDTNWLQRDKPFRGF